MPRTRKPMHPFVLACAAVALLAVLVPAGASAQEPEQVTICHAIAADQFQTIVVPAGDPQIAAHEGHAGDIIQQGAGGCPEPPPVNENPGPIEPPPGDCPGCDPPKVDPAPPTVGTVTDTGDAPASAPLPETGASLLLLALALVLASGLAYGLVRASKRLRRIAR